MTSAKIKFGPNGTSRQGPRQTQTLRCHHRRPTGLRRLAGRGLGARVAVHACPIALVRGSLVVEAEDSVRETALFHLRFDILAKLSEVLGSGIITDLEFRIASATPRRPPQSAQSHSESVAADDADSIKDPVMRILYKQARNRAAKKATA